jgi:hypothetical protein
MHAVRAVLDWIQNNILGNLVADILAGLPALLHLKKHINKRTGGDNG